MHKRLPHFMLAAFATLAPAAPGLIVAGTAHAQNQAEARMHARQAALTQQVILRAVAQLAPAHPLRRRYRLAIPFGDPLFPPDDSLRAAPGQPEDPALDTWLRLPRSARAHDVLITPDSDYYWRRDGRDYSAQFIVHLGAGPADGAFAPGAASGLAGPAGVAEMAGKAGKAGIADAKGLVYVLQVHATHRLGRRFQLLGRTGPGYYWELRPAPPSATAAAELAAFLAAALEGQQR